MRTTTIPALLLILSCAGAGISRHDVAASQAAVATAIAIKPIVEQAYEPWDQYVADQVERCTRELPPAEHTRSEFDACLGPAIEHERSVTPALEAYHAAALVLYVAITSQQSGPQIVEARNDLAAAGARLVRSIPAVNQQIERVKRAIGDEP